MQSDILPLTSSLTFHSKRKLAKKLAFYVDGLRTCTCTVRFGLRQSRMGFPVRMGVHVHVYVYCTCSAAGGATDPNTKYSTGMKWKMITIVVSQEPGCIRRKATLKMRNKYLAVLNGIIKYHWLLCVFIYSSRSIGMGIWTMNRNLEIGLLTRNR